MTRLPGPSIPLARLGLCPDCERAFDMSEGACPKCGSEHFVALSLRWMRPAEERGSSAGILEKAMLYDELVRGQK